MAETVAVHLDQVQELTLREIELDVLNIGDMIIFQRTGQIHKQKRARTYTTNV